MAKLPAFQFYPADWRKSPDVQAMSYFDRGVWFEILCLMHESDERGRLLLSGKPMRDDALARILGLSRPKLEKTLATILDFGVAFRDDEGVLCNRRMMRDERIRQVRTEAGGKGGNPNLVNQNPTKEPSKNQPLHLPLHLPLHTSDLKRLINACVRENSTVDPKAVEAGVYYTLLQRNGATDPINSLAYFRPQIERVVRESGDLKDSGWKSLLTVRREQVMKSKAVTA